MELFSKYSNLRENQLNVKDRQTGDVLWLNCAPRIIAR